MNPATGTICQDGVIVTKTKDVGRLYSKSKFGTSISKNKLLLNFIEACFLSEEKKLTVYHNGKKVQWEKLVSLAAEKQEKFETNYLIFSDLRRRGHQLQFLKDSFSFTFYTKNQQDIDSPPSLVATFSEREPCTIQSLLSLIKQSNKKQATCWLAITDEEGDVTYYDLDSYPLTGKQKPVTFTKTNGILLKDRVIILNKKIAETLHEKEFFGKPFGKGLQISLVEALYLMKNKALTLHSTSGEQVKIKEFERIVKKRQQDLNQRYIVFNDLKKQGLIVKTGFKFGNHFRAYSDKPDKTHAEYLVHAVSLTDTLGWSEVSRAIRLAHSVNKIFLFASIDDQEIIRYLAFKRIRP
ncbi:MAG: tRNA-intron lyase [Candidatus Thermoplasmatota archaeon]|nr:tRNA-intron lyase [Candidatus Thermoplasmatota archaeon]